MRRRQTTGTQLDHGGPFLSPVPHEGRWPPGTYEPCVSDDPKGLLGPSGGLNEVPEQTIEGSTCVQPGELNWTALSIPPGNLITV